MKWYNRKYTFILVVITLFACEKVVELPIEDAAPKLVVEAVAKSLPGESYILLSKSIGFYDDPVEVNWVDGANVQVVDESGEVFTFAGTGMPGEYRHPTFYLEPNQFYDLKVEAEGQELNSESRTLTIPQIDSLFAFQQISTDLQGNPDTSNILIYTVSDNPVEKNFYRFVLWVNGEKDDEIFIETDDLGNGATYTSPFFGISFDSGDHIYAELWSMTKDNYAYFSALYTNLNQSPFSAAPSDLPSNIEGGGIGYFGAFMVDTASIIIP